MSLDRLQKEIDALTYNARTVLNALIRSVTAAGNNKGFKATRVGEVIFLNRVDIYRLYKFYEEWADNLFAKEDKVATEESGALDGFDTIRARHDQTSVTADNGEKDTTATSTALTKHGKILFKTNDNANFTDEQWIELVKNHNNPKLVSNSSPIPLCLRSPVFDENLSTAHYHNYPTYLFPMDYFKIDVLGYSGDDTDHHLDGKSWTIEGDEFVKVVSKKIELGRFIQEAEYKTANKRTGDYALSFGYNCHAQAAYSVAGGRDCIVPSNETYDGSVDTTNAIAIGNSNIASDVDSIAIGGKLNSVSDRNAGIFAGERNTVTARGGVILGGEDNVVGGKPYHFRFPTGVVSTNNTTVENPDCVTTTPESEVTNANNVIIVTGNYTENFPKNSEVTLFDFEYKSSDGTTNNSYYEANGSARQAIHVTIDGSEYVPADSDSPDAGNTRIILRQDIPEKGIITGGYVSLTKTEKRFYPGEYSGAVGRQLIVEGEAQFAVGLSNKVQREARFLVGAGDTCNSFEVYNEGFVAYGIKNTNNTFIGAINAPDIAREPATSFVGMEFAKRGFDVLVEYNRLRLYKDVIVNDTTRSGFEMASQIGTDGEEFGIRADTEDGITLYSQHATRNITLLTGTEPIFTFLSGTENTFEGSIGFFSQKKAYIVGREGVTIRAATGGENQGTLTLEWQTALKFIGNSWGTLPTDQDQYAHYMVDSISTINDQYLNETENWGVITLYKTGFYRVDGAANPIILSSNNINQVNRNVTGQETPTDYFLLNVGYVTTLNEYFNWQMFIGADPRISEDVHIGVRRGVSTSNNRDSNYYTNNAVDGSNIKYIGWLQDYQYSYSLVTGSTEQVNFGTWRDVPQNLVNIYQGTTEASVEAEISYHMNDYGSIPGELEVPTLKYTKMNNLIFFNLTFTLTELGAPEDNVIAIIINPSIEGIAWDNIFLPKSTSAYPTFVDSHLFRELAGALELPSYRFYTCQAIRNQDNLSQFRFLITKSTPNGINNNNGNVFSAETDSGITLTFTGSYETEYSTTEER